MGANIPASLREYYQPLYRPLWIVHLIRLRAVLMASRDLNRVAMVCRARFLALGLDPHGAGALVGQA